MKPSQTPSPVQRHVKLDANGYEMLIHLEEDVLSEAPVIILQIVASETPMPDLALSLYHTLNRRNRSQTLLVTRALTSLTPPEGLLWLCGDERDCLPSAGLLLPGRGESLEENSAWRSASAEWGPTDVISATMRNWTTQIFRHQMPLLRREIAKFVELPEADTYLSPPDLLDWGLLGEAFNHILQNSEVLPDPAEPELPPSCDPPLDNPRQDLLG